MLAFVGGKRGQGWGLYVVGWDGSGLQNLTASIDSKQALFLDPVWSPSGHKLALTFRRQILQPNTQVCIIEIDQPELVELTPEHASCFVKSWLSDGSIVYIESHLRPGEEDRYLNLMSEDGRGTRRIFQISCYRGVTFEPGSFQAVEISQNGQKLGLVEWGSQRLFIKMRDSQPVRLDDIELRIHGLAWHPDSRRLAFTAVKSTARVFQNLYLLDTDSGHLQQLGRVAVDCAASWSPDGRYIACVGYTQGEYKYQVIEIDSGESTEVLGSEAEFAHADQLDTPQWSPDGESLAMIRLEGSTYGIRQVDIHSGESSLLVDPGQDFTQMMYLTSAV
jgi:Tol biopolymer transport system component